MKKLLFWLLFITALMAPNLLFVQRTGFYGDVWDATQFALFALATLVLPIALLPLRFALILLVPCLLFIPAAMLHVAILGSPVSKGMILSSLYSSPHEVLTVLATRPYYTVLAFGLLGLGSIAAFVLWRRRKEMDLPRSGKISLGLLISGLYLLVSLPLDARNTATKIFQYPSWTLGMLAGNRANGPFTDLYPFGFASRIARVVVDIRSLKKWEAQRSQTQWTVSRHPHVPQSEVHIVVLGESSRRDHWQLYGYDRPTTPYVSEENQVVALGNIISPANVTINSVIQILSKATPTQIERAYNESSISMAYRKAGFKTFWISNSEMIGKFSTPITMIAHDSEQNSFLSNIDPDAMDEKLVDEVEKALADPAPRKFMVLHMKGSHVDYKNRFTAAFNKFQPSQFGRKSIDWTGVSRDEVINTYDNSLLYSDAILGRLIQRLKLTPGHSSLTFVSDHGEQLMDDGSRDIGHPSSQGTAAEFEVPFIIWLNDSYVADHPRRFANLSRNKNLPASSLILFDSLLGLTGLKIEGHRPEKDIFSESYKGSPRPILLPNGDVKDFDRDIKGEEISGSPAADGQPAH